MGAARKMPCPSSAGDEALGPYKFDRRRHARHEAADQRLAVIFGSRGGRWLLPVDLRDVSPSGLGLASSVELEPGDRITLFDRGSRTSFVRGRVARCARQADGRYRVGVVTRIGTTAA